MPTNNTTDAELDKIRKNVRWGDYQKPDGTWGRGVANWPEIETAILAWHNKALQEAVLVDKDLLKQWLDAQGTDCYYDHDGNCQAHFIQPADECIYRITKLRIAELKALQEKS